MDQEQAKQFDCWAIVELFGYNRIAGRVTTQTVGIAALFRVDVPEVVVPEQREQTYSYELSGPVERVVPEHRIGGYTRFFGVGAIYAINPTSEDLARRAVLEIEPLPGRPREITIRKTLPAAPAGAEVDEDDEDAET